MNNLFLFSIFPYLSLFVMISGTIFRFTRQSYSISSLSSQFLEFKGLFWGSNTFHFGIIILFFGHLAAFIVPGAVLSWNSIPLRLVILEITAFSSGFLVLSGLFILIVRRIFFGRVRIIVSKIDILVYLSLLVQIISGLWIAWFHRWGSSWFSSVLTPYLYSVFSFNPDNAAISTMALSIKIHVVNAFLIFAIIPFSRFFHFMAFPFSYFWRSYQLVIWNYDRKKIRVNTGKKNS
jgi:nitrate reductase gamma subunit